MADGLRPSTSKPFLFGGRSGRRSFDNDRLDGFWGTRERRRQRKAVRLFRDVLARCQPPRCAETIPAEAYRAYDALVDSVLARAGFEREPLPLGLIRERTKDAAREPECVEYLGPWLPQKRGPRTRSGEI